MGRNYNWQMHPDTVFEAKRMTNGKWVRGQVIGEEPFVYILTHENYNESVADEENVKGECIVRMRLIRVIGASVRKLDRFARLAIPEDKNNADFGVGDVVRGKCVNGFVFDGNIFRIDVEKEGDKLHPIMFISQLPDSKVEEFGHAVIRIADITELEILRFKEENRTKGKGGCG